MSTDIDTRFREFNQNNPQVYAELVRLAHLAKGHGRKRIGVRMIWEVMRWNLTITVTPNSDFKLNDHYHSRYARLIMEREADLAGVFETRELRSVTSLDTDDDADEESAEDILADIIKKV